MSETSVVFSHLVAGEEGGGAEQLRDAPEGLLLSGLSGREVERRDHVVVSEAGVGAGLEESLNGRDVPAERRVVQGRPTHLKQSSKKRTVRKRKAGAGGESEATYIYIWAGRGRQTLSSTTNGLESTLKERIGK